jgi:hypothetical protein
MGDSLSLGTIRPVGSNLGPRSCCVRCSPERSPRPDFAGGGRFEISPSLSSDGSIRPDPAIKSGTVAKVFLGWRTKILRAADAFYARRREGPYRFIQNRSRTSVLALKSTQRQRSPKINFREIFRVARFSTFATISARNRQGQPTSYSITSSARPSNVVGTVIPIALAVIKLMISVVFVDSCTQRSYPARCQNVGSQR